MNAGALLYTRLSGYSGVSTLVSTRIYPSMLPQQPTMPAIVYQNISDTGNIGSTDLHSGRYQFSCWASSYAGSQALADQVEAALEEYVGVSGSVILKMARRVNRLDDYDPDTELHRVIVDCILEIC